MHPGQVSWDAGGNKSKYYWGIVCQLLVGYSRVMLGLSGTWASVISTAHLAAVQPCPVGCRVNMQNVVEIGHIFDVDYVCNLWKCVAPCWCINWYVCTGGWLATCGAVYASMYWPYVNFQSSGVWTAAQSIKHIILVLQWVRVLIFWQCYPVQCKS